MVPKATITDNATKELDNPAPRGVGTSAVMIILVLLGIWIVGSLPVGMLVGAVLAQSEPPAAWHDMRRESVPRSAA